MDYRKMSEIEEMIEHEIFYGIPISEIDGDMMDTMTNDELRELYTIVTMLHWRQIDQIVEKVNSA